MSLSPGTTALLASLPEQIGGTGSMYVVDRNGEVLFQAGEEDGTTFRVGSDGVQVDVPSHRTAMQVLLPSGDAIFVATFVDDCDPGTVKLLEQLLEVACEREQLEQDMESMNSSSLALLEEVSMMGETLPNLSAGEDDREIAAMGLKALLVAASVERAVYLRHHEETGLCEVLVHAVMDDAGQAVLGPYEGDLSLPADEGLIAEVLRSGEEVLLRSVPAGGALGEPGSPERLAHSQVIGVPVCYGSGDKRVSLGAVLVMDKRATSYSNLLHLGSQESKLALSIASMLGAVLGARKVAELGKELSLAQQIQEQILPDEPAIVSGFDLAGDYHTSGDVGGDYFDYLTLADGRTLAVVADVSGHNLASGMVMVSARATLRALVGRRRSPPRIFEELARSLHGDLERTERFITAAAVALAPDSRKLEIVNAGHNDLMLYRAKTKTVKRLRSQDTIFGFLPGTRYHSQMVEMRPGDFLLLYTDGVTEAADETGEMFGEERLERVLQDAAGGSAREVLEAVFTSVADFADKDDKGDDITAVVIRSLPARRRRR